MDASNDPSTTSASGTVMNGTVMNGTVQLIYASTAVDAFTPDHLADLLAAARSHNQRRGISGLLVYHEGAFLQVLEGADSDVDSVYRRITGDSRHTNCRLLLRTDIDEREFGEWSMGFVDPRRAARGLAGYVDYTTDLSALVMDTARVKNLLLQFREGAWH